MPYRMTDQRLVSIYPLQVMANVINLLTWDCQSPKRIYRSYLWCHLRTTCQGLPPWVSLQVVMASFSSLLLLTVIESSYLKYLLLSFQGSFCVKKRSGFFLSEKTPSLYSRGKGQSCSLQSDCLQFINICSSDFIDFSTAFFVQFSCFHFFAHDECSRFLKKSVWYFIAFWLSQEDSASLLISFPTPIKGRWIASKSS